MSMFGFLLGLMVVLAGPAIVVGYARRCLARAAYVWRYLGLFVLSIASVAIAENGYPAIYLPLYVLNLFGYRWTAMRSNDVGWSRWWALLWLLWPAGLVLTVILCFKRSTGLDADVAAVFD